jgi:HSP20 family molecular chaperone IbpA
MTKTVFILIHLFSFCLNPLTKYLVKSRKKLKEIFLIYSSTTSSHHMTKRDFNLFDLNYMIDWTTGLSDKYNILAQPSNVMDIVYHPLDVRTNKDSYEVWIDVPGVSKEDLELYLKDRVLTIECKRKGTGAAGAVGAAGAADTKDFSINERPTRAFKRAVEFKTRVDVASRVTKLENGVFYIKLFKAEPDNGVEILL